MDTLNKTIKKLNEPEYQELLSAVAGRKNNKPYLVLEAARKENYDETQMMEMLSVNPSTYYTLKSRLNERIAQYLSKNVKNPISALKDKVAMVPAMLFSNDREVAIRALKNLEKQLIEYDLSNELIVVYKVLARLSMYNGDFDYYEKEYNRHVAYSLAVVKAEDLFYDFVKRAGNYQLTRDERDLEAVQANLRELTNFSELYQGHRLFILYNLVRVYYLCLFTSRSENLKALELEVDGILQQIKKNFEKFELDTFYQSIRFMVDYLYFEYYQKTGNAVRADHYYKIINKDVPEVAFKPIFGFYVTQFLQSKIERYLESGNITDLTDLNAELEPNFDVDPNEAYPYISFRRFLAVCKFYEGDYSGAARTMNSLRNELSMKKYLFTDVEYKLFQAMQYCFMGEDGLCSQLLQSVKRQITEDEKLYEPATIFIKMLKTAIKPEEFRKKVKKLTEIYEAYRQANVGNKRMLWYVKLDEAMIRRMANPIKE
ncbi:MAG: hypothetical protein IPO49_02805 [Bacteroidetes bacterium]|nr:hypothetical protein [Bacteroidota bacterium]